MLIEPVTDKSHQTIIHPSVSFDKICLIGCGCLFSLYANVRNICQIHLMYLLYHFWGGFYPFFTIHGAIVQYSIDSIVRRRTVHYSTLLCVCVFWTSTHGWSLIGQYVDTNLYITATDYPERSMEVVRKEFMYVHFVVCIFLINRLHQSRVS